MSKIIAVYGSLREGMYNHDYMKRQEAKKLASAKLSGFVMYSLGNFPFVTRGFGSIFVEVYEVSEETFNRLDEMEKGARYQSIEVNVGEHKATMWVYPEYGQGSPIVKSGDWCAFTKKNKRAK